MAKVAVELQYSDEHEWVARGAGNVVSIGISAVATDALGDIVYVDIETEGESLDAEAVFGTVEAVKTVSEIYSPVSGKVIDINTAINDNPSVVNTDPYGEGWIFKIEPNNMDELNNLMSSDDYKKLIGV